MDSLTVSSALLITSAVDVEITPAMLTVLWNLAHELDRQRVPADSKSAVWIDIPSRQLRNPNGKTDNHWLKICLNRLMGVKIEGAEWGAVILAQWEIAEGGSVTRLLVPPAAIQTIRAPHTFAKIEIAAVYQLKGHARRLYAALADKKRMRQQHWEYPLSELQRLFQIEGKYSKWYDFRRYVLNPALSEINNFGTVTVKAKPKRVGRSVKAVRFNWEWKEPRAASETVTENERHSKARRKKQTDTDAPPMIEDQKQATPALTWWHGLTDNERDDWADRVGRTFQVESLNGTTLTMPRRESDIAGKAFIESQGGNLRSDPRPCGQALDPPP